MAYSLPQILIILVVFIVFMIVSPIQTKGAPANGNVLHVGGSGTGNYSSIQDAITNTSDNDTIYVYSGTFYENVLINKSINLIGEDKNTTILDGGQKDNVIKITANQVTVTGFTLKNSGDVFPKAGVNISSNNNTITDNILKNNFYGITMFHASNNVIHKNIISDDDHCGIYMSVSQNNIISKNTIKNHTYNGIGIYDASNSNTITENILINNSNCGINIRLSSSNNIVDNNFICNNIGICEPISKYKNYIDIANNTFSENTKNIEKEFEIPVSFMLLIMIGASLLVIVIFYWEQKRQKTKNPNLEKTTHSLDTKGKLCPVPLIMTKKKIKKIKEGEILEIITDDIVAKENIERYAKEKHSLVNIKEKDNVYKICIKKK